MPAVQTTKVEIQGLKELLASLDELPKRVRKKVMNKGLKAGVGVIRDEARRLVPVRYGALQKAIIARLNKPKGTFFFAEVTINRSAYTLDKKGRAKKIPKDSRRKRKYYKGELYPKNYAHLVEFGTQPHALGHGRMHPGAQPKPFLRPAYEAKKTLAIEVMRSTMLEAIDVEVVKLAAAAAKGASR